MSGDAKNGLLLKTILTDANCYDQRLQTWSELVSVISAVLSEGTIVAYFNNEVQTGRIKAQNCEFYQLKEFSTRYLLKLRAFNDRQELMLWKKQGDLFGVRSRVDGQGEEQDVALARQLLWGKVKECKDGWVKLTEERGTEIILPYTHQLNYGSRLFLETQNYISYNDLGQAGYTDCRFVGFAREVIE